jgi:predicted transposase/invertase (TIGR01784 family)
MYMKYRHIKRAQPLIRELCRKEKGIMRAEKTVIKIDSDYIKYIHNMNILKNSMDRAQRIYNIEQKAQAKGLAEGQTKEKLEIARKMKNAGRPLSEIEEFTGLSADAIRDIQADNSQNTSHGAHGVHGAHGKD